MCSKCHYQLRNETLYEAMPVRGAVTRFHFATIGPVSALFLLEPEKSVKSVGMGLVRIKILKIVFVIGQRPL